MKPPLRVLVAATSLLVSVGACFATDSTTGMGGGQAPAELAIQPALIPSPADGGAEPINRIRAVAARVPDHAVLGQTVIDVSPTADSWSVDLTVTQSGEEETTVVVFLYLIHVEGGVESVQFSGRSDPILLIPGEMISPDIPIVRGPVANLSVTDVAITSVPTTMVVGESQPLSATVSTSETVEPEIFWTSHDPGVLSFEGSTVRALAPGTADVTASAGAFSDIATITVHGPLMLTTTSLPAVTVGSDYSETLTAAGGDGGYTWEVTSGSPPPQLGLNPSTGEIFGTATNVGSSTFTVTVTSRDGQTASRQFTITVHDVLAVTTASLPPAPQNAPYDQTLTASGGDGVYAWTVSSGALPPGLTLNGSTGAITGVLTTQGVYGFTVTVMSGDGQTAEASLFIEVIEAGLGQVVGVVYDAVTSQVITAASLSLMDGNLSLQTTSDANGAFTFAAVPGGTYTVVATADGYIQNAAANLDVVDVSGDVVRADFALPPEGSEKRFGGLSGRVLDNVGSPRAGASVSISGGVQTNGIFRSTITDADGTYSLVGIVLDDTNGAPIDQFTVLATAAGFATAQTPITLIENETVPNVDFALSTSQGGDVYFRDGFETGEGWTAEGFWNRSTLGDIVNAAVPTYVSLAPGDASKGALPAPVEGAYAFWYGEAATGNFMGEQSPYDQAGSGGTSVLPNQGSLTSPVLQIPLGAPNASLRFETWFEIESENPNDQGFDLMTIGVYDEGKGVLTPLGRLNPFVDPTLANRVAIPFTSGGFNARPVWRTEYLDLSAFAGANIRVVFIFDTVDGAYNGFRGWVIDNVVVSDEAVPAGAPALAPATTGPSQPRESR
jgi:hypothetical protein